jgi:hypothetical protein
MHRHAPRLALSAAAVLSLSLTSLAPEALASAPPSGQPIVSDVASFHWSSALASPRMVRLDGTNGSITVSASTDGKLDVRATVSDGDPARVKVVAREEGAGVVVCVLYADESPDACRVGGVNRSGSGKGHHNDPTVDLIARVPAGVSVAAETLNGGIHVNASGSEVRATTLNGNIDVSGATVTEATTLNGNVEASLSSPPAGRTAFTSNNGNVKVRLPGATNADVEASTMRGEITVTFPMTIESTPGGFGPKNGKGKIGSGGPKLEAKTINGNVEIRTGG